MWRRLLWVFLGVEALRFAMWIIFLLWLVSAYDPLKWVGPEAPLISILAAAWLGFPYGWIASRWAGTWNFLPMGDQVPMSIAFSHFGLWLLVSVFVAWALYRLARLKRRPTVSTTPD